MDDLEVNPLYRALLTKYRKELEIACNLSCLIAIPHSESLQNLKIDQVLINSHILMPSKLRKMHFAPLQGGLCVKIELNSRELLVSISDNRSNHVAEQITINVLAEDTGYSSSHNKTYKIVVIDRPIILRGATSLVMTSRTQHRHHRDRNIPKPLNLLTDHDDCLKYLDFLSPSLTTALELDVKRVQSTYMILTDFLSDASAKIKILVNVYVPKFVKLLETRSRLRLDDNTISLIYLSLENYVVHLLHGKLMASVLHKYCGAGEIFLQKMDQISKQNLSIIDLGAQKVFANFILDDNITRAIRSLSYLQSPLAIVSAITRLVKLLSEGLSQSVETKDVCRAPSGSVAICSDDLIATIIYSIIQVKPSNLYSISRYLEIFGTSASAKDQSAYCTATFQIAIQYLFSYDGRDDETTNELAN